MKFRIKIALSMICLISLLFGIGGSTLIAISFESTLEREKETVRKSYQLLINTLQVLDSLDAWANSNDVAAALRQLSGQDGTTWSMLSLASEKKTLYEQGSDTASLIDMAQQLDGEHYLLSGFTDSRGAQYLQLSSLLMIEKEKLYLDVGYDISFIYEMREQQQTAYDRIFTVMVILCSLLSYVTSFFITRPLTKLSRAAKAIASGNLAYRSNISSNDEIGALSADFDTMAIQVQDIVAKLQESIEGQESFMGSFAHELKTPMTSIIGYADLLRGQTLTPDEQIDAANYIFSEGKRLETLSLKLLEVFVAGKQELLKTAVSPALVIADVVKHLEPAYREENIAFRYQYEKGLCFLDGDLFRSLLLNLFDNARKSFDRGGIISVRQTLTQDGCIVFIEDNGKGIPPKALEHLPEAFYRVDKARSRKQGGAGLGLMLCAKIARLHHGTIRFEAKQVHGTIVTVELKGGRP